MENNKKYCILCGAENKLADKFCHKCGQSFDQKDDDLQNYAKDKIKGKVTDKIKDTATESFLEMLKKFLNSKAYGVILSLSIVAAAANILTGGSKINEFSNNIPGMFIDGSVYGVTLDGTEILFQHGITAYGKRDASGNIYMMYLKGSTSYFCDFYITVTGSDGKVIRQDELLHYDEKTENSEDYLIAIDDLYCTIESKYNNFHDNRVSVCTVKMNGPVGIKSLTEYENDVLVWDQEFYDTGVEKYFYRVSGHTVLENGDIENSTEEIFYNEDGEVLKDIEMLGDTVVKSRIREDYPDGSYKYTDEYNGEIDDIYVYDAQDRVIESHAYMYGEFYFKEVFEYYETGELLSEAFYDEEDDAYPTTIKYYNMDGSLKQEIRYYTDTGAVRSDTVYDGNGSAVCNEYYYDNGSLLSVSYLQQRDDGVYNPVKVTQYDRQGNVTSEKEYDLDGNLISEIQYDN